VKAYVAQANVVEVKLDEVGVGDLIKHLDHLETLDDAEALELRGQTTRQRGEVAVLALYRHLLNVAGADVYGG